MKELAMGLAISLLDIRRPQDRRSQIPEGACSASPGLLESNPRRRLTMSEHREHLLPDTEDISCRGAPIVGLHAGMRQRIYRRPRSAQGRALAAPPPLIRGLGAIGGVTGPVRATPLYDVETSYEQQSCDFRNATGPVSTETAAERDGSCHRCGGDGR